MRVVTRRGRLVGACGRHLSLTVRKPGMRSFAGASTELAFDLSLELRGTGRSDLARELEACTINA